jgi:hypothetical protein
LFISRQGFAEEMDKRTYALQGIYLPAGADVKINEFQASTTFRFPWIYPYRGFDNHMQEKGLDSIEAQINQALSNIFSAIDELSHMHQMETSNAYAWLEMKVGAAKEYFKQGHDPAFIGENYLRDVLSGYKIGCSIDIVPYKLIKDVKIVMQPLIAVPIGL